MMDLSKLSIDYIELGIALNALSAKKDCIDTSVSSLNEAELSSTHIAAYMYKTGLVTIGKIMESYKELVEKDISTITQYVENMEKLDKTIH